MMLVLAPPLGKMDFAASVPFARCGGEGHQCGLCCLMDWARLTWDQFRLCVAIKVGFSVSLNGAPVAGVRAVAKRGRKVDVALAAAAINATGSAHSRASSLSCLSVRPALQPPGRGSATSRRLRRVRVATQRGRGAAVDFLGIRLGVATRTSHAPSVALFKS